MNKNEKKIYKGYMQDLADCHNKEVEALREEIEKFRNKNEILKEENEKLKKENKELELQLTVEKLDQHALEHYTKQNEKLQDQINTLNTKIARNEAYIKRIQHKELKEMNIGGYE